MKNPFKNEDLTDKTEPEIKDSEELEPTECAESETSDKSEETTNQEFDKLKDDYEALNAQYMRLAADFENFRKRNDAEREALLRYGTENALTKMIEVIDNFERAQKSLENVEDIKKYKESIELLHKQVVDTLSKMGMEPINAQGQTFDPHFHDAVMQTPTSEYPEHTVIAELQKGYKLGDKILRPSLVNVATAE